MGEEGEAAAATRGRARATTTGWVAQREQLTELSLPHRHLLQVLKAARDISRRQHASKADTPEALLVTVRALGLGGACA